MRAVPGWTSRYRTEELAANALKNVAELQRGIELANRFDDIVVAVNVGNEALVEWNDHMVPLEKVIAYVRQVKAAIDQPVTVADNYEWWIQDGAPLAAEVDFLGVHTYPAWEEKTIDEALPYTIENMQARACGPAGQTDRHTRSRLGERRHRVRRSRQRSQAGALLSRT